MMSINCFKTIYKSKLVKNLLLLMLVALLSYVFYALWVEKGFTLSPTRLVYNDDISKQAPVKCTNNPDHKVWLVSYANEAYIENQNYQTYSAINKCVDFFLPYRPHDLDKNFVEKNSKILSQKRGGGYWLWKPYVILKALNLAPENDIIIYLDSGASVLRPLDDFVNQLGDKGDIVVFRNFHDNTEYMKRDLLKLFNMDTEETRKTIGVGAGFMAIKNTPFARQFIKEWLKWCENENALTDVPSQNEYSEFKDHRHDQSILTLLWIINQQGEDKDKIITSDNSGYYKYFLLHRRRSVETFSILNFEIKTRFNLWFNKNAAKPNY